MTPKVCKYGCGVMLDAWDEEARKYREAGSGGLHTKERCEEMKAKSRTVQGEKNNHGNEDSRYGGAKIGPILKKMQDDETKLEAKNDHGNEESKPISPKEYVEKLGYVDHTLTKDDWAFQIFTDPTPEGLMLKYNNFRKEHKVNRGQYHPVNALYTIAVWYSEETK